MDLNDEQVHAQFRKYLQKEPRTPTKRPKRMFAPTPLDDSCVKALGDSLVPTVTKACVTLGDTPVTDKSSVKIPCTLPVPAKSSVKRPVPVPDKSSVPVPDKPRKTTRSYQSTLIPIGNGKYVKVCMHQRNVRINIREYITDETTGRKMSTKRGMMLTPNQWDRLKSIFCDVDKNLKEIYSSL